MKNDDPELKMYQDDLDTNPGKIDEATHELTDEPSDTLLVPNSAIKRDLDAMALDDLEHGANNNDYEEGENRREDIEDKDQGDWGNPDRSDNKS